METFSSGDLTIEVRETALSPSGPASLALLWSGTSNHRQPTTLLAPFFSAVLARATLQAASIEMRFELLEHFNSSTITAIIQVVQEARARGVKLVLAFDPTLKWQRLSFDALRIFVKSDGLLELLAIPSAPRTPSLSQKAASVHEP